MGHDLAGTARAGVAAGLFEQMTLVRRFEERVLKLFEIGRLSGTTHACIGQEGIAAAVITHLEPRDFIFSSHRCHGHFLVRFNDPAGLLAELMGRTGGACGGRAGSQHLCGPNFYSSGVQGGYIPIAAGAAFAESRAASGAIVVAFIGDGTLGEGVVYETLNLIALWPVPLLVVLENNGYAQTTPIAKNLAGTIIERVQAFGVSVGECEGDDTLALYHRFQRVTGEVRRSGAPHVEVVRTYRLCAHSKGDDTRPPEEIEAWRRRDPLQTLRRTLDPCVAAGIEAAVLARLQAVEAEVDRMPLATFKGKAF